MALIPSSPPLATSVSDSRGDSAGGFAPGRPRRPGHRVDPGEAPGSGQSQGLGADGRGQLGAEEEVVIRALPVAHPDAAGQARHVYAGPPQAAVIGGPLATRSGRAGP